jgi:hypothetical protein
MVRGKLFDWHERGLITITKMEQLDDCSYRVEVKELPDKYFVARANATLDSMYGDFKDGRTITLEFDNTDSQPNGVTRNVD